MQFEQNVDELIRQHDDYAASLARQIAKELPAHVEYEELLAWGRLGLVEAANRYQFNMGVSFETFAYYRIRGAIFDGLRKMTWLPPAARAAVKAQSGGDAVAEDSGDTSSASDPEVLAAQFRQSLKSLGAVFLLSQGGEEDEDADLQDERDPVEQIAQTELLLRIRQAVGQLAENESAIIRMHYFEDRSFTECAAALGIHKAWVSRLHKRAVENLQKILGAAALNDTS